MLPQHGQHNVPVDYAGMGKVETEVRFTPPRITPRVKSWADGVERERGKRGGKNKRSAGLGPAAGWPLP